MRAESLYFHIPFCLSKCHYCSFPIHAIGKKNIDTQFDYFNATYNENLMKEVSIYLNETEKIKPKSLYFGGGTPSLYPIKNYKYLFDHLQKYLDISKDTEITIECDPNTFDKQYLQDLKKIGFNRISLGI